MTLMQNLSKSCFMIGNLKPILLLSKKSLSTYLYDNKSFMWEGGMPPPPLVNIYDPSMYNEVLYVDMCLCLLTLAHLHSKFAPMTVDI
jgi:hypothetical protein